MTNEIALYSYDAVSLLRAVGAGGRASGEMTLRVRSRGDIRDGPENRSGTGCEVFPRRHFRRAPCSSAANGRSTRLSFPVAETIAGGACKSDSN